MVWFRFQTKLKLGWNQATAGQQPGVNFINIVHTAFALVDPESLRTQSSCCIILRIWDLRVKMLYIEN